MTDAAKKSDLADLDSMREEIESLRKNLANLVHDAGQAGNGMSHRLAEKGRHIASKVGEGGEHLIEAATHEIEERPLASVLVAFALGFVGGRFLSR